MLSLTHEPRLLAVALAGRVAPIPMPRATAERAE